MLINTPDIGLWFGERDHFNIQIRITGGGNLPLRCPASPCIVGCQCSIDVLVKAIKFVAE